MDIRNLLTGNQFFKAIFDAIPSLALVINQEGKVLFVNEEGKKLFGIYSDDIVYMQEGGNVLHCIHISDHEDGCGFGPECKDCIIRQSAMKAIAGNNVHREKGKFIRIENDEIKRLNVSVTSAPIDYDGMKMAIVIIEDISNIVELEGMVPICSSCKEIRDDKGNWTRLEKYIEERSEAEFTHDICPRCSEEQLQEYMHKKAQGASQILRDRN